MQYPAQTPKVLLVEDEPTQRDLIVYNLEAENYDVAEAQDGEEALLLIDECLPDVILLDWILPGISGLEVCRRLRARLETRDVPIIMLSARGEEADRVRGLDTGADDFVAKPFSMCELLARIRSLLRRTRPASLGRQLTFKDVMLDPETHRAYRDGEPLRIGPTEFRLLTTLMEKPGRVWDRAQLLDRVWGQDIFVETRTVDVHVGRLRRALCKGGRQNLIRTIRGTGYALG